MLNPIEQTPSLAYEPVRQQYTPPQPAEPQAPPSPTVQVQAADSSASSQDSSPQDGSGDQGAGSDPQGKAWAEATQKLGAAWGYLQELKSQATAALSNGDTHAAEELADEAATVAANLRSIAGSTVSLPSTVGTPQPAGGGDTTASGTALGSAGGTTASGTALGSAGTTTPGGTVLGSAGGSSADASGVFDLARAGLSTAKDVVDLASQISFFSTADRGALDAYASKVRDAMAGLENLALNTPAVQAAAGATAAVGVAAAHVDIKA
jgi:hypothetical protein